MRLISCLCLSRAFSVEPEGTFFIFDENLRDDLAEENLKNEIPSIKVSKIAHLDITSNGEALGTIDIGLFGDQARRNKLFLMQSFLFSSMRQIYLNSRAGGIKYCSRWRVVSVKTF